MTFEIVFVLLSLLGMMAALIMFPVLRSVTYC